MTYICNNKTIESNYPKAVTGPNDNCIVMELWGRQTWFNLLKPKYSFGKN